MFIVSNLIRSKGAPQWNSRLQELTLQPHRSYGEKRLSLGRRLAQT